MTNFLLESAEAPALATVKGGLLDSALAAPSGWQNGLAIPFNGCGEPIVRNKCVSGTDVPHRGSDVAEFYPFPVEQGSSCSTLGSLDQKARAKQRLDATLEWAVARQFAEDLVGLGSPSLADAEVLGTVADGDFVSAVACLEQAAADAGFGSEWWVHAPTRAAAYLASNRLIDNERRTPGGGRWVISPGYPVQAATTVRLWVTSPVFAAAGAPDIHSAVDWRTNEDTAWALGTGLVAFDPCINFAIDVTVPACPTP